MKQRLAGLDALRGIAALLVLGLHARAVFGGAHWFSKGYLAVDFFLMLSGFLMVRSTEPRLSAGLAPLRFMVARYKRFWPMVALGSLIGVPYLWVRAAGAWDQFLPALIANFPHHVAARRGRRRPPPRLPRGEPGRPAPGR